MRRSACRSLAATARVKLAGEVAARYGRGNGASCRGGALKSGSCVGGADKVDAQSRGDIRNAVPNGRGTAAGEEKGDGLNCVRGHDQRAGIATRAERAAVDKHLIGVGDDELLAFAATALILHFDVRADGGDGGTGEACCASTLRHLTANSRAVIGSDRAGGITDFQDGARGIYLVNDDLREGRVHIGVAKGDGFGKRRNRLS